MSAFTHYPILSCSSADGVLFCAPFAGRASRRRCFVDFNGAVSAVFEGKDLNAYDDTEVIRLAVAHLRVVIA